MKQESDTMPMSAMQMSISEVIVMSAEEGNKCLQGITNLFLKQMFKIG